MTRRRILPPCPDAVNPCVLRHTPANGVVWGPEATGEGGPHTHPISDIDDLTATLEAKADAGHAHAIADITNLPQTLNAKAASTHSHAIGDTTGLQAALDGKSATGHTHAQSDVTGLVVALNGKAASSHGHAQSDITGLVTALGAKQDASEKGQANGYAALDATGKVPSTQLPASSGGSDPWTVVALASDFTTSSATAVDVTGLAFTPVANTRYMLEVLLYLRTNTATVNPRPGFAWATGLTDGVLQGDESQTATTRLMANGNSAAAVLFAVGGLPNTNQSWPATLWGGCIAGASPSGTCRVQIASETAGTVVTVKAGSYLRFRTY